MKPQCIFFFLVFLALSARAQSHKIHSHNDYAQPVAFWDAYANGMASIEVDVFLKNNTLYVTHDEADIKQERTLQNLYLDPLAQALTLGLGELKQLQLLIDIKSDYKSTLAQLMVVLEQYPLIANNKDIALVISGNRPPSAAYPQYPDHIMFDHQSLEEVKDQKVLDKIALISLNFKNLTPWNGKGRLTAEDLAKVNEAVEMAHSYGKPIRFWATPDSKTAWKALADLGVDFINTDRPKEAAQYLKTLSERHYHNTLTSEVYVPSFAHDQTNKPVKNIILLIGDGNGLAQISAAALANGGALTLTQLKSLGLIKTQAADDFTTDSAAAATALATGQKTNNRAIGVGPQGERLTAITELLHTRGYLTGCITTDDVTGATPAAFYAHRKDRSDEDGLMTDLLQSSLTLLIGGGNAFLEREMPKAGFELLAGTGDMAHSKADRVALFLSQNGVPSVREGRGNLLAEATKQGLAFLAAKNTPFLLMVEAAQIDSYGHGNDVGGIITEGIDFDRAITEAIIFADAHEDTLVLVTADHETSGFSLPQGHMGNRSVEGDFTTDDHTGIMVPLFAYGPQSHLFQGVYENTAVHAKMLKVLDIHVSE